jgi:hypothetical protein
MIRPWNGVQAVAAASQPVFGTTLTAAIVPSVDQHTGTNGPGTSAPPITITVTSTAGFVQNDRIAIGPKTNFTAANRKLLDLGTITAVVDGTHLKVQGLTQTHLSTDYVVLSEMCAAVYVVPVSTTAIIYLGTDETVAAADASVFDVIAKVSATTAEPTYWHQSSPTGRADSYDTSQYWLLGTAADTFVARFQQN